MPTLKEIRSSKTYAYTVPFVAFMLLQMLSGPFFVANEGLHWTRHAPEHWVYPLQTVVCLGLIAWWWRCYDFKPVTSKGMIFGIVIGVVGWLLWVVPTMLYDALDVASWAQPGFVQYLPFIDKEDFDLWAMLGLAGREGKELGEGFKPDVFAGNALAWWSTVLMRFIRMAIAVALLEEFFWRGFVWRYLIDFDKPFWKFQIGTFHLRAISISILLFILGHAPVDYLGCLLYGLLISWVAVRTKSLMPCVICHGVTNLLLGIYVMVTEKWGFW